MDVCSIAALITPERIEHALAVAGSIVMLASALCAVWPHPAPGSRLAKLRGALELLAMLVGHAKASGSLPTTRADKLALEAADFLKSIE
jgi:hypothetical protein